MKQRWMRGVAVILVLCLLFGDNLTELFMRAQAVEQDSLFASVDVSEIQEELEEGAEVPEESEELSEELEGLEGESEVPEEGSELAEESEELEDGTGVLAEEESGESTELPEGEQEELEEDTEASKEEQGEESGEGTELSEESEEQEEDAGLGEEVGLEEESAPEDESVLEEVLEEEMYEEMADGEEMPSMQMFALAREVSFPSTESAYRSAVQNGTKTFYLTNAQDFINAQSFCEVDGFNGITLIVASPESGQIWDMTSIAGFNGIGSVTRPFQGTLQCGYQSGIEFKINKPIIAYMGNGATISQMNIECVGSSAAIAQNISGTVSVQDVTIRGTIGNGTGTVGLFASSMESESSVNANNLQVSVTTINGAIAGGFAGTAGDNVTVSLSNKVTSGTIQVTGSEAAGGCFGSVTGSYTFDLTLQQKFSVQVSGDGDVGQVAGSIRPSDSGGTLNITGGNRIEVNLSGTGNRGGLVGYVIDGANIAVPSSILTIAGTMSGDAKNCGGVAGVIDADNGDDIWVPAAIVLKNYMIEVSVVGGTNVGGLVGFLGWGQYIIGDVTIGTVTGKSVGGLIGYMGSSVLELQKGIEISQKPSGTVCAGLLIGDRNDWCFAYLAETGLIENTVTTSVTDLEEIGIGGSVFRNQFVSGGLLIGNKSIGQVGKVNKVVEKSGDWYQLKTAADFECLAIVLNSSGEYGREAFGMGADKTNDEVCSHLLQAWYNVTNNVNISYAETGIVTLNRNDKVEPEYAFSGKMEGDSSSITITQNNRIRQQRLGLFSTLTGNSSFSNLTLAGSFSRAIGVGGLAYEIVGNGENLGLTLENITTRRTFTDNTGYIGGVLALESNKFNQESGEGLFTLTAHNITLESVIEAGNEENFSGFVTQMDGAIVNIGCQDGLNCEDGVSCKHGVKLGGNISSTVNRKDSDNETVKVGGFLGRQWMLVGGVIKNVTVIPGTKYTSSGTFGGLLTVVTTNCYATKVRDRRIILDKVILSGLTVNVVEEHKCCGLLIQDGQEAVIEVIDYNSQGCVIEGETEYFDEIVGRTEDSDDEDGFPHKSGIVSIHSSTAYYPAYHYENQVEALQDKINKYTTYFYDVFQYIENADGTINENAVLQRESGKYFILDDPVKMLIWNLAQVAHGDIKDTFIGYYATSRRDRVPDQKRPHSYASDYYKIKGEVNVSGISFYPIPKLQENIFECDNGKIIFGATEEMENWGLSNVERGSQHYGLQAGLFYNEHYTLENIQISNLTLSGVIANMGIYSGGLFVGSSQAEGGVNGQAQFTNITLDNLRICGYDNSGDPAALLIADIPDGQVTFENIQMVNYPDYPTASNTHAASSLIRTAGSDVAANLVLRFERMKIADGKVAATHNGNALSHASFLYSYDYTDDALVNKGSGIYWFSEDEAESDNVTYGAELTEDTEFSDTENTVLKMLEETTGTSEVDYIPYVYQNKDIEVNPKTGDILKGCGTYEDPYMIENVKQFLTLYRYMNDELVDGKYQYDAFYNAGQKWKVIKPGDDSKFCGEKHRVSLGNDGSYEGVGTEDVVTFGDENFPTPKQLSAAYYQLGADIDLSAVGSATYKVIAEEFIGFGTEKTPFVGVWHGNNHTITMPSKAGRTVTNYGFIQYAQGAVVKDLTIKSASTNSKNEPKITGEAGSVFARILGGDNIIDNVTVDMYLNVSSNKVYAGGYVGVVKKGGLILRNLSASKLTLSFSQRYAEDGGLAAIVGRVEDGYVVYEGAGTGSVIWQGITELNGYPAVQNYAILNADALKESDLSVSTTEDTSTNRTMVVHIPDAEGLQIMSMALNADALNVRPSGYEGKTDWGYTEKSRCRKAKYDTIGTATQTADYFAAAKYDNVMKYEEGYGDGWRAKYAHAYPYLYDLMDITGDEYSNYQIWAGEFTNLNPAISVLNNQTYQVTWELAENKKYDMSQFGEAFRGIGEVYVSRNGKGGTFHGDFHGNNSTIHLNMTRGISSGETPNHSWARVGLFNTVYCANTDAFLFKDFTITGSIIGVEHFGGMFHAAMGGLAAGLYSDGTKNENVINFTIQNVQIGSKDTPLKLGTVETSSQAGLAGGLVGIVASNARILIKDCKVTCNDETSKEKISNSVYACNNAGGLIGGVHDKDSNVTIENVEVEYLEAIATCATGPSEDYGNAGGLVGLLKNGVITVTGTEENPSSVSKSNITAIKSGGLIGYAHTQVNFSHVKCTDSQIGMSTNVRNAGGIIGFAEHSLTVSDAFCNGLTVGAYKSAGGIVGDITNSSIKGTISNVEIRDSYITETYNYNGQIEGIGGVVGTNERQLTMENVQVTGTKSDEIYNFSIIGSPHERTNMLGVGGLVGAHYADKAVLKLKDCTVDTVELFGSELITNTNPAQDVGVGGLIGIVSAAVQIDSTGSVAAQNLDVSVPMGAAIETTKALAAGGAFGYVCYQEDSRYGSITCGANNAAYTAINVTGNTVSGKNAGGLIGYSEQGTFTLKGVQITDNEVTADTYAGGLLGYWKQGVNHVENITVQSNAVVANSAGGFIGGYEAGSGQPASIFDVQLKSNIIAADWSNGGDEVLDFAVGGLIGRTVRNGSSVSVSLHCDGIFIEDTNQIAVIDWQDNLTGVGMGDDGYYYATPSLPAWLVENGNTVDGTIEWLEQTYGCFRGAFVGVWEADNIQMYLTDSKEKQGRFAFPVMENNPPVVDVGRKPGQGVDDYRKYCHVIYGEVTNVATAETKHLAEVKKQVDAALASYTGTENLSEVLTGLRATGDAMNLFNASYQENYQIPGSDIDVEVQFPMVVYRVQNGTIQEIMENVTDMMTNVAGSSASDVEILSVQCDPMVFNGSTSVVGTKSAISVKKENGGVVYERDGYDGLTPEGNLCYTRVTFTYDNNGRIKEFVVPVFVEEPILYSVHSKIIEGNVSDASTIREKGMSEDNADIIMGNDSNYTLLLEYSYGEVRKQMPNGVATEKEFYLLGASDYKVWPEGTQILLIDVTGGNKAYYYTIPEGGKTVIRFTDFSDSKGEAYVNKPINALKDETDPGQEYYTDLGEHQLTNTGVERFILTVLSNDAAVKTETYSFHAGLSVADPGLASRFQLVEEHHDESVWGIKAIAGLDVSLDSENTAISGSISNTDEITVQATFEIKAKDGLYWVERNKENSSVIDSANSSKYLEVAFYLRDKEGNRVALPQGTNFSYQIQIEDGSDQIGQSENKVVADNSMVYYYKDIRELYGDENFDYKMGNLEGDTEETVTFVLDFAGADLSMILDNEYVAWIELLRTGNRDYPMGNGNSVDSFSKAIEASASQELGFALLAENLDTLGINTYPGPRTQDIIPGQIMFDFSQHLELVDGVGRDMVLEKWARFDYEVTYRLYQKTGNGYVPYIGDDIWVEISDNSSGVSADNLLIGEEPDGANYWKVVYNMSAEEMKKGNGDNPVNGVVTFPCRIVQNTKDLVSDTDKLTNYKLEATLEIREAGAGESASATIQTTDFFIYTVTKLKSDL